MALFTGNIDYGLEINPAVCPSTAVLNTVFTCFLGLKVYDPYNMVYSLKLLTDPNLTSEGC